MSQSERSYVIVHTEYVDSQVNIDSTTYEVKLISNNAVIGTVTETIDLTDVDQSKDDWIDLVEPVTHGFNIAGKEVTKCGPIDNAAYEVYKDFADRYENVPKYSE